MPRTTTQKKLPATRRNPQPSPGDREYEVFLRELDLIALGLKDCSASVERHKYYAIPRDAKRREVTSSYRVATFDQGRDDDHFDCEGEFAVRIFSKTDAHPALVVACTIEAHFHTPKNTPREFADRFASSELKLVLIPYFRSYVTDLTARMAIAPIVVPLSAR